MTATLEKPMKSPKPVLFGLLAEYNTPDELVHAAEKVRDAGYKRWDCHTPFPVHGLDKAMGVKPTILPWLVLGAGLTGTTVALLLQFYVNTPYLTFGGFFSFISSYPLVYSNKPYFPLPANIPVAFELTVLFASLTCFFGVWGLSGLPQFYHPLFTVPRFRKVTDDKFFIVIQADDEKFGSQRTHDLLASTHPAALEEVKD